MPTIDGPEGKKYNAVELPFEGSDPVAVYRAERGVTVRVKSAVMRIYLAVDENGVAVRLPNGEPLVQVQSANLVSASIE